MDMALADTGIVSGQPEQQRYLPVVECNHDELCLLLDDLLAQWTQAPFDLLEQLGVAQHHDGRSTLPSLSADQLDHEVVDCPATNHETALPVSPIRR
tara:strand:- start:26739 stop:27029 length:291 start_codon:yes stop_codon:yes gene_type:complete